MEKTTKTEEQQQTVTQEQNYPTTLREVINYRQTGRKEDVPDDLSWHTCDQGCTQLEEDNLFYKYLNQSVVQHIHLDGSWDLTIWDTQTGKQQ